MQISELTAMAETAFRSATDFLGFSTVGVAVDIEERIKEAYTEIAKLKERAGAYQKKVRTLRIEGETRRLRMDKAKTAQAEADTMIRAFVRKLKSAKTASQARFTFAGFSYSVEDGKRQVARWCPDLRKRKREMDLHGRARDLYVHAADRMDAQAKIITDSVQDLNDRLEELVVRRNLLEVEKDVVEITSTLSGIHQGDVGAAFQAIADDVDRLLATINIDRRRAAEELPSLDVARAGLSFSVDDSEIRKLVDTYLE